MASSSSSTPQPSSIEPRVNRHLLTAVERQRAQLDKLLKDPAKPAFIPTPPKEKTIRPPREMMKNVQGSSAGAGSGEFHVYKASRRREYERLKMLDEKAQKEADNLALESKKREWEEQAEAKSSKNRAKRQKKKERAKAKGAEKPREGSSTGKKAGGAAEDAPLKKRRLVNGQEMTFRRPGVGSDEEGEDDDDDNGVGPSPLPSNAEHLQDHPGVSPALVVEDRIRIHEDD